jgi:hypothetical protein
LAVLASGNNISSAGYRGAVKLWQIIGEIIIFI